MVVPLGGVEVHDRPMEAIRVRGLRKTYVTGRRRNGAPNGTQRVEAVRGIDLTVGSGEIVALLGPNGAGKTTTVEILEGVRRRDEGDVSVLGIDPALADAAWRERVGIVWQTTGAFDDLTVREVVTHFAGLYRRPRPVAELIDRVGLDGKTDERIGRLSGGQRRRLDVALGIVGRPDLLFLDEPTTGFDPAARRHFWELVRALRDEGTTIVLTTHYLEEAEALADRVAVISQGRIVAEGPPADLGGRALQEATVEWDEPGAGRRSIETATPTAVVRELAVRLHGEVPGLVVHRPTLEDVYLRLIEAPATSGVDPSAGAVSSEPSSPITPAVDQIGVRS
jgi:ABC-2 type transport system ATP-binding protein